MTKSLVFILGCLCAGTAFAQKGVVAAGGDATGSGGSISYSYGQIDYVTATGTGGTITEGLQQPYEIFVVTGIDEAGIELFATVFPNPARESITLRVSMPMNGELSYRIFDVNGKLISEQPVLAELTLIDVSQLALSTYFIKVMRNNTETKTFRFIKNI